MNSTASPPVPWSPEYERLTVHFSSCPTCVAVDEKEGVNLELPCAQGERVRAEYRQACQKARPTPSSLPGR